MHRFLSRPVHAAGAAIFAEACANPGSAASEKEDMLASAGFVPRKADNAVRLATLKSLPLHQFVTRTINGRPTYLYADPTICGCIYVGNQTAYDQYPAENGRASNRDGRTDPRHHEDLAIAWRSRDLAAAGHRDSGRQRPSTSVSSPSAGRGFLVTEEP
jgi:hypothetical protein